MVDLTADLILARAEPESKALTLDELRQMDGEPVWVVVLEDVERNPPYWAIVDTANGRRSRGARLISHIDDDSGAYEMYRESWLAYRAMPVVRGEWINTYADNEGIGDFVKHCSVCCNAIIKSLSASLNYCPNCGAKMEDKP